MRNLDLEPFGRATLKRELRARGAEPDDCFYVQNAHRIIGKQSLDLERDPPPDIVVEIDTTNESLSKFPIYMALGVPEIWRFDGRSTHIYGLAGRDYSEASTSRAFPLLSSETITEYLELGEMRGQSLARRAFRARVRKLLEATP